MIATLPMMMTTKEYINLRVKNLMADEGTGIKNCSNL